MDRQRDDVLGFSVPSFTRFGFNLFDNQSGIVTGFVLNGMQQHLFGFLCRHSRDAFELCSLFLQYGLQFLFPADHILFLLRYLLFTLAQGSFLLVERFGLAIKVFFFLQDSLFEVLEFFPAFFGFFLELQFHLEEAVLGLKDRLFFDCFSLFFCLGDQISSIVFEFAVLFFQPKVPDKVP